MTEPPAVGGVLDLGRPEGDLLDPSGCGGRRARPPSTCLCRSRSLSRTSVLVRPVTFLRMRVPDGLKPRLTAPMYRFLDAFWLPGHHAEGPR